MLKTFFVRWVSQVLLYYNFAGMETGSQGLAPFHLKTNSETKIQKKILGFQIQITFL